MNKNTKLFVAIDVGCIECGEDTNILGIFESLDKAHEACDAARSLQNERWRGEHYMIVEEVNRLNNFVMPKYEKKNTNFSDFKAMLAKEERKARERKARQVRRAKRRRR